MKCNRCARRSCKGENSLQDAQACAYFRQPHYRERRMIDRLTDESIQELFIFRNSLNKGE